MDTNGLRNMWMLVLFDLPVGSDAQRKTARKFREYLLDEGFGMVQYSVYAKFVGSRSSTAATEGRIKDHIPPEGKVEIIKFTDKQYGEIVIFWGREEQKPSSCPEQLLLF